MDIGESSHGTRHVHVTPWMNVYALDDTTLSLCETMTTETVGVKRASYVNNTYIIRIHV